MSILMKKPRIEEIAEALGDAKKTLLGVLDGPGEQARYDLDKGPLPVGGAPLVRRSVLSYGGKEYPGVYLRTSLGSHFIEVSGKDECATYEVDEAHRSLRKVDEALSAEELRRVLGDSSGGGSGLPEDYAASLQSLIQFVGTKTEVGGDMEVDGKASVNTLPFRVQDIAFASLPVKNLYQGMGDLGITLPVILIYCHSKGAIGDAELTASGVFAILQTKLEQKTDANTVSAYVPLSGVMVYDDEFNPVATLDDAIAKGHLELLTLSAGDKVGFDDENKYFTLNGTEIPKAVFQNLEVRFGLTARIDYNSTINELARIGYSGGGSDTIADILGRKSEAKYQHAVTISGEGFEFCLTAPSSKNLVVDSYQDLEAVFGGDRIGLTGYSAALSAKPVLIDLHGGTVATDFIRVFEENGSVFSNKTLASLGTVTYTDDVYIPN